jgi:hypothetical protein
MDLVKGLVGLVATVGIAAVVAYGVSAPRNVDNFMDQEQASLDGKSINQSIAETQAEVRQEQCEQATRMAEDAWNRAMDQGTADRDASTLDELDARVSQFCNG